MDKEQIKNIKRHEWLMVSVAGRKQILEATKSTLQANEFVLAELLATPLDNDRYVPLIARREDYYVGEQVPCGFVHPQLVNGRRWRLACFAQAEQIQAVITPYEVWLMQNRTYNRQLTLLSELKKIAAQMQLTVGILGSLALECYTGLRYSNENSDIDLIVKGASCEQIKIFLEQAMQLATHEQIKVDLEIELTNGYGIKAQELFMDTKTILGKSKQDVALLEKPEVLACLK